jgi:hypothetical protein
MVVSTSDRTLAPRSAVGPLGPAIDRLERLHADLRARRDELRRLHAHLTAGHGAPLAELFDEGRGGPRRPPGQGGPGDRPVPARPRARPTRARRAAVPRCRVADPDRRAQAPARRGRHPGRAPGRDRRRLRRLRGGLHDRAPPGDRAVRTPDVRHRHLVPAGAGARTPSSPAPRPDHPSPGGRGHPGRPSPPRSPRPDRSQHALQVSRPRVLPRRHRAVWDRLRGAHGGHLQPHPQADQRQPDHAGGRPRQGAVGLVELHGVPHAARRGRLLRARADQGVRAPRPGLHPRDVDRPREDVPGAAADVEVRLQPRPRRTI